MERSPRLSPRISIPKLPIGGGLRSKTLDEKRRAFQERRRKAAAERAAQAARARAAAAASASDDGGLSQQHQEVLMKLMEEFPNETPEELSARFAEMMRTGGVAPPPSMVPVDPQRQQKVLEELLQQYPDKPLEELAMMATERLEGKAPATPAMPGMPAMMPGTPGTPGMGAPMGMPGMPFMGMGLPGMPFPGAAATTGAPWDDAQPQPAKKAPAETPEQAQKRARARARRANPDATEAELDVLALDHVPQARSAKRPPAQRTMTPAENYRRAVADVKRERPGLGDPEAVGRAALSKLQSPRAADRKTEAALEALRALPPAKRQQKILLDLLEEFPDRPLEELAAEAAARLDAVARPPGAEPGVDADLIKELARRHPDKSPAEVAAVATRIAAERATRDRTAGSNAAAASLPKKKTPRGGLETIEESPQQKKPPPVDKAALEAFAKMQSGGKAPGIDEVRELVCRTLRDDPFADPDKKDPGLLSDMAKLGEAGVARVEAREKALAEASERRKATRDALSQAQVVENKMMARVLRGSSQDVQLLVRHPGLWERWLGKLRKRGFFDGVDEGSPEFDERVRKALRAFARSPGVREFDSG